jgi:glycerol-3-phosphate acyltransferase PlsX
MDPNAVGAAPLLGIDGLVFVGHGRSNSTALISAIKVVREALNVDLVGTVRQSIQEELA